MGGRNAKPITLHLAEKNPSHLTKAEIEQRKKAEIKLGDQKLKCPQFVKTDVNAYAKWKEIVKIYKDIDFVSSGDTGLLGRYCMTFSEYQKLLEQRKRIDNIDMMGPDEREELEHYIDEDLAEDLINKVNYIISVDGVLKIDTAINKKMDQLVKMEDRLFLNPLAKVKNVPKKEPEKIDPLANKGFGNV
ncbi:MAG: terminase [Firmicutes bacterium]|nr:terminase [Bacillota bacterium]